MVSSMSWPGEMTAMVAVAASREYAEVWRTDDCAAFESVYADENGVTCSELVIWSADGSRYREVIGGVDLAKIRRDWEAASPQHFNSVLVPDDAGRKVWTHLEPEPVAEPVPEPVPDRVERSAKDVAAVPRDPQDEPYKHSKPVKSV
jgi:hypothetical protein